jgi:hypothetical protein
MRYKTPSNRGTPRPTPTPIPALAPGESPTLGLESDALLVEVLVLVRDVVGDEDVVVVAKSASFQRMEIPLAFTP